MAAADYQYNPGADLPANLIVEEVQTINVANDRSVWMRQGPFFQFSLTVEIRASLTAPWVELRKYHDYYLGPEFGHASEAAGKRISSYIVIPTDAVEVRLTYRCLGEEVDTNLLQWVAKEQAEGRLDRSLTEHWLRMAVMARLYNPRVHDPDMLEVSWQEVMNSQLAKIVLALSNPNTLSPLDQEAKLTQLEAALSLKLDKSELVDQSRVYDKRTLMVGGVANVIYVFPSTDDIVELRIAFTAAGDDDHEVQTATIFLINGTPKVAYRDLIAPEGPTRVAIDASISGGNINITAIADVDGVMYVKSIIKV